MLNDSFLKRVVCQRPHNLKDEHRAPSCRPRKRDSGRYKSTTTSAQLRFSKSPCPTANIFSPLRVRWPTSGWKFAFRELYHPSNLLPPYFHLDGNTESVRSDDRTLPPAVTYPPPILSSYSQTFFPNLHHFISSPFFLVASFAPSSIAISRKKSSVTLPPSRNSWRVEGVEERRFEKGGRGKRRRRRRRRRKRNNRVSLG